MLAQVFSLLRAKSFPSCLTPWDLMDRSSPSSSVGFSRQEYWSELPCPPLGRSSLNPGVETASIISPVLAGRFFTSTTWEATSTTSPARCFWACVWLHLKWWTAFWIGNEKGLIILARIKTLLRITPHIFLITVLFYSLEALWYFKALRV